MNIKKLIVSLLLLVVPLIGSANEKIDSDLEKCLETASATASLSTCYQQANQSWDQELNIQYKALMVIASPEAQKHLKQTQTSWIKYKEDYITALQKFYTAQDGTIWSTINSEAVMNITKDKAIDLKRVVGSTNLCGAENC